MPLTWEPAHRYYQRAKEGYHVSKSASRGKWRYTAWAPRQGETWPPRARVVMLGCHDSEAEAKAECARHARGEM
jgi:hypothetical protein